MSALKRALARTGLSPFHPFASGNNEVGITRAPTQPKFFLVMAGARAGSGRYLERIVGTLDIGGKRLVDYGKQLALFRQLAGEGEFGLAVAGLI